MLLLFFLKQKNKLNGTFVYEFPCDLINSKQNHNKQKRVENCLISGHFFLVEISSKSGPQGKYKHDKV